MTATDGTYAGAVRPDELKHLRRARDLIDREYARPLDVPALARAALMSPAHFSRQFRAAYGETPYSYLMTRRIERAKALLRRGDLSVTDVCMAVGCTSLGSFSARFTELVGETPSAYRARNHAALAPVPVRSLDAVGLDPDAKEAVAFAVLANETLFGRPGNLPGATGAAGPRVLGKLIV